MKSLRMIGIPQARAGGAQVLERAAEMRLVGQHRERRGTAALIGGDLGAHVGPSRDLPGVRRAPLELGDQGEPRAHQGLAEGAVLAAPGQARFEIGLRKLAATCLHSLPGPGDQLVDDSHWTARA